MIIVKFHVYFRYYNAGLHEAHRWVLPADVREVPRSVNHTEHIRKLHSTPKR